MMDLKLLALPSDEQREEIWRQIGLNRQRIKEAVEKLKKWLKQQPHLPDEADDNTLERWLLSCKNSLEKTKQTLDLYYTLRGISPEYMTGWDPTGEWFERALSVGAAFPVKDLTPEGDRVTFFCLSTPDAANFDFVSILKMSLLMLEIRTVEDYWRGDILVMDLKHFNMAHIPKITFPMVKKFEVILMRGYKYRLKSVHLIYVPPIAEFVINMVKSVLSNKMANRIRTYGSDFSEMFEHVPRKVLPDELDGDGGTIQDNKERWKEKLRSYREWFLEREKMKTEESKRPGKVVDSGEVFGIEGSFRKLDLD